MTLRITLGIDPGITGAIAILVDGVPRDFLDMPCRPKPSGNGQEVHAARLAATLRGLRAHHAGAHVFAVIEHISMRPNNSRGTDQTTGENLGIVKGVLGALDIGWSQVQPQRWKKHFGLLKTEKDDARIYAMNRYSTLGTSLSRKRDNGRADALLIGVWGHETEAHA